MTIKKATRESFGEKIVELGKKNDKIVMLTAYDYQTAVLEDRSGIDMILVGDSLGMTVLGYENTLPVTLEEIVHHLKGVSRARPSAFLVGDLPFMSYQASAQDAVRNAGRALKEGGAEAVKLEGGRRMEPVLRAIIDADIPVMGHIGLTPQSLHHFGGYRVQGRDEGSAAKLLDEAKFLEDVGCFSMVVEGVPWQLAQRMGTGFSLPGIAADSQPTAEQVIQGLNPDARIGMQQLQDTSPSGAVFDDGKPIILGMDDVDTQVAQIQADLYYIPI